MGLTPEQQKEAEIVVEALAPVLKTVWDMIWNAIRGRAVNSAQIVVDLQQAVDTLRITLAELPAKLAADDAKIDEMIAKKNDP